MLGTQLIIHMPDVIVGLFTVMVFLMIDVICSTENDVVMNVSFVNVGSHNVRVFSFQKFIGKLYADLMSFLIRYFSGHKCLNQMESFVWVCLIGF